MHDFIGRTTGTGWESGRCGHFVMMCRKQAPAGHPVDTVDSVETAESILAKFDERIARLEADNAKERRAVRAARTKPARASSARASSDREELLQVRGLVKHYGDTTAVDGVDLTVEAGTIFGIVGPNGAGKTTTLSMVTGLLRPDAGTVIVHGADVWRDPAAAKRQMGVLPDRLRLFDRLTGSQLLYYAGVLRGLPPATVRERMAQLATSFGLEGALGRLVADYSAGMTKKLSLAAALIHSPRLLVLDEPFESVDPVSASNIIEILRRYVAAGGTVVLSSHSMDLTERVCDSVAIVVDGHVLASGTVAKVRGHGTLEERFVELAGGRTTVEGMEWLHSFSD
jgi:ABC-2 type transport system ATP-binding protein